MGSGVRVGGIVLILPLGVWGWIQGWIRSYFLPQNTLIQRCGSGVQTPGPMSGVMNLCWVFNDWPVGEITCSFVALRLEV